MNIATIIADQQPAGTPSPAVGEGEAMATVTKPNDAATPPAALRGYTCLVTLPGDATAYLVRDGRLYELREVLSPEGEAADLEERSVESATAGRWSVASYRREAARAIKGWLAGSRKAVGS